MGAGSKPSNGKDREARERARVYQARTTFHAGQQKRRTRDNWIAGVVAGVLIVGAVVSQVAYYGIGPGAPTPEPSSSSTPAPTPSATPTETPAPDTTTAP